MENKISAQGISFGKINLFLYILGKRQDGYHDIYTLFKSISLHDTITLTISEKNSLKCNNPLVPTDESNIIYKIDKILRDRYGLNKFFEVKLDKQIPIGSGLGGGSSNAATYLSLANELGELKLSKDIMHNILAEVGSDAPFFLYLPSAIGEGRGEVLTPIKSLPKMFLLIINPQISILARDIYGSEKLELTSLDDIPRISPSISLKDLVSVMRNDMQKAVYSKHPVVKELVDAVAETGALKAMMSGSGPTVFGVYALEKQRDNAFEKLAGKFPLYIIEKV